MVVHQPCNTRVCVAARDWRAATPAQANRFAANRRFRRRVPMIELTRQIKNQPEREILENGENPEIRKIRNSKQKCTKPEFYKDPAKYGKTKEGQKKQNQKQNRSSKRQVKRHITRWLFKMGNQCKRRQPTGRAKTNPGCVERVGYGVMQ